MARPDPNTRFEFAPDATTRIGQSKRPWARALDSDTATTALANPVPVNTLPVAAAGTTGAIQTHSDSMARIMIGGTDAANETINYQVVLWRRAGTVSGADANAYIPELIAKGVATLGATTFTVDDIGSGAEFFADTITNTLARTGVAVNSSADDAIATIEVDVHNACAIEVETDLATAASSDVFVQMGENVHPFELHSLVAGSKLPAGQSLYDVMGAFTGPASGTAADDNVKAALDLLRTTGGAYRQFRTDDANLLTSVVNLGSVGWKEVAAHKLLVASGSVRVRMIMNIDVGWDSATDAAVFEGIGVSGNTDAFLCTTNPVTVADAAPGGLVPVAGGALSGSGTITSVVADVYIENAPICYEVTGEVFTDPSTFTVYVWWEPLSTGATLVLDDGSAP